MTNFSGNGAVIAGFVLAVPLGIAVMGSQAATIILGQEYLPNRLGIASGITLGVGVSIGGMFSPVLGRIADSYGLHASLLTIAALAAVLGAAQLRAARPREAPRLTRRSRRHRSRLGRPGKRAEKARHG